MMRLHKLQIRNFRSIDATGIVIEPRNSLVLFVGKNNAGKSTIADALHLLLGSKNSRYASFPEADYNDPSKPIELMVEFDGLQWGDGAKLGLSQPQCAMLTRQAKGGEPGSLSIDVFVPPLDAAALSLAATEEDADQDKKACTIRKYSGRAREGLALSHGAFERVGYQSPCRQRPGPTRWYPCGPDSIRRSPDQFGRLIGHGYLHSIFRLRRQAQGFRHSGSVMGFALSGENERERWVELGDGSTGREKAPSARRRSTP
jgi:AAA ATPase domain